MPVTASPNFSSGIVAVDQAWCVGQLTCHRFPDAGKVPIPHVRVRTIRQLA